MSCVRATCKATGSVVVQCKEAGASAKFESTGFSASNAGAVSSGPSVDVGPSTRLKVTASRMGCMIAWPRLAHPGPAASTNIRSNETNNSGLRSKDDAFSNSCSNSELVPITLARCSMSVSEAWGLRDKD
jgi:hypothetical protein